VIKNNKTDIEIALTRAMLAIGAVAAYVYKPASNEWPGYACSGLLLLMAVFTKRIIKKINYGKWIMLAIAAVSLYLATGNIVFPVMLFAYGAILKFLVIDPVITISEKEVMVKRNYVTNNYPWPDFNNVILKDGLLSLDFKSNKIKYFNITEEVDEKEFNLFCESILATDYTD
jgi:hypothetical protein